MVPALATAPTPAGAAVTERCSQMADGPARTTCVERLRTRAKTPNRPMPRDEPVLLLKVFPSLGGESSGGGGGRNK
jgi:hypothetical protein